MIFIDHIEVLSKKCTMIVKQPLSMRLFGRKFKPIVHTRHISILRFLGNIVDDRI